jgi:hypothetical protein
MTGVNPDLSEGAYEDFPDALPPRPRMQLVTKWSVLLAILLACAIGFFVGVRIEKSKIPAASTASGTASRFAALAGGASGSKGALASGFASRFGGSFPGAGTSGSVTAIDGNTLYVKESSGNTVKVKLSSATAITKEAPVAKTKIFPGDEVTVVGASGSDGTVSATRLTDSGSNSAGSAASSAGSSGTASSAVSSLFGGS